MEKPEKETVCYSNLKNLKNTFPTFTLTNNKADPNLFLTARTKLALRVTYS